VHGPRAGSFGIQSLGRKQKIMETMCIFLKENLIPAISILGKKHQMKKTGPAFQQRNIQIQ
jgi:hypothetical protein